MFWMLKYTINWFPIFRAALVRYEVDKGRKAQQNLQCNNDYEKDIANGLIYEPWFKPMKSFVTYQNKQPLKMKNYKIPIEKK